MGKWRSKVVSHLQEVLAIVLDILLLQAAEAGAVLFVEVVWLALRQAELL